MIHDEPFPFKQVSLWFLLLFCGLIAAFLLFIALISVWVSLTHLHQDGFWMPLLVGIIGIGATFWLFIIFARFILGKMKEKDIINNI
jgi:uncharacterized membrane protein HdeD (DUF308 family)